MSEWPADWFRDGKPPRRPGAPQEAGRDVRAAAGHPDAPPPGTGARGTGAGGAGDRTVHLPGSAAHGPGQGIPGSGAAAPPSSGGGVTAAAARQPAGGWPDQPPLRSASDGRGGRETMSPAGPGGGGAAPPQAGAGRRRPRARRILAIVAAVVVVLLVGTAGMYFYLNSKLTRVKVLTAYSGRPAASAGQNWLITGSAGHLTHKQARKLHTGYEVDPTSDTIILLHIPANGGRPILVSLPRDSYVPIPGHGNSKINAAYSYGGAPLLVRTVEEVTGLRINHYLGIGYAGLVNAVNAVGGVRMCVSHALRDPASGLHLKKGCQSLNGKQALAFVRTRHPFATQDLQREQNQRVFIKALLDKMTSPGTMLNPFAIIPAANGSAGALTVDQGTQLYQLANIAFALRNPITTTVPIANANYLTPAGDAVEWNRKEALQLFNALRMDRPVPKRLLTGSHLQG